MNEVRKYSGMTWVEVVVCIAILVLLVAVLIPRGGHPREQSNRMACAANLSSIAKSMCIYANDNYDAFPTVVTQTLRQVGAEAGAGDTGSADAQVAARSFYTPGERRATQCLWLLVMLGQAQPKQLVCRSDAAKEALETVSTSNPNWASDFGSSRNLSYSLASPWVEGVPMPASGPAGPVRAPWWRNNVDSSQPILADGIKAGADFSRAAEVCPNHIGTGSNVAFQDGHAEWVPVTQQGANYSLQVPSGGTAPDASGIYATGAVFPSGRYVTPTTITATKVGTVYDMIFVPPLVGR